MYLNNHFFYFETQGLRVEKSDWSLPAEIKGKKCFPEALVLFCVAYFLLSGIFKTSWVTTGKLENTTTTKSVHCSKLY